MNVVVVVGDDRRCTVIELRSLFSPEFGFTVSPLCGGSDGRWTAGRRRRPATTGGQEEDDARSRRCNQRPRARHWWWRS
jgi:hypothetical protein